LVKLNFDGAFLDASMTGAWGFIARNHEGQGLLAGAGRLQPAHDAVCAEAEACRAALQAASMHGITHCQIKTDSTILVTALKSRSYDQAIGGVLFKVLRDLISLEFVQVEIMFSPRS
ncbi:hypothetical protein BAE44_0020381, partial [Dichanthelium oligosanthes]